MYIYSVLRLKEQRKYELKLHRPINQDDIVGVCTLHLVKFTLSFSFMCRTSETSGATCWQYVIPCVQLVVEWKCLWFIITRDYHSLSIGGR